MRHPVQRSLIALREKLGLTQQGLAVELGKAVVTVARWETSRLPSLEELGGLIQFAISKGEMQIAAELARGFLEALPLEKLTRGFASFSRADLDAETVGYMLVVARGTEQSNAVMAFYRAFMDLASGEQPRKKRAAAALRPLMQAYLDPAESGRK